MKYKSLFINLENKTCYVIGGSWSAVEISQFLMQDGALVTVWSETFVPEFTELIKKYPKQLSLLQAEFTVDVAEHYCSAKVKPFVVITTLPDEAANQKITDICKKNNVLSADPQAENSEVVFVNNISEDPIELAVLTKGMPELNKKLQKIVAEYIKKNWLDAVQMYNAHIQSEAIINLEQAEYRIYIKRLTEEIIKNEGDFEKALKETKHYYNKLKEKDALLLELADERSFMD